MYIAHRRSPIAITPAERTPAQRSYRRSRRQHVTDRGAVAAQNNTKYPRLKRCPYLPLGVRNLSTLPLNRGSRALHR